MMPLPRSAGNRRISRAEAVERCARLMVADDGMTLDQAWRYVTGGLELGRWRRDIGIEVSLVVASLDYPEDPRTPSSNRASSGRLARRPPASRLRS